MYDRNILSSSSEVFGTRRLSSDILETFGKVQAAFGHCLENLRKSSESRQKPSENIYFLVCLYIVKHGKQENRLDLH